MSRKFSDRTENRNYINRGSRGFSLKWLIILIIVFTILACLSELGVIDSSVAEVDVKIFGEGGIAEVFDGLKGFCIWFGICVAILVIATLCSKSTHDFIERAMFERKEKRLQQEQYEEAERIAKEHRDKWKEQEVLKSKNVKIGPYAHLNKLEIEYKDNNDYDDVENDRQ